MSDCEEMLLCADDEPIIDELLTYIQQMPVEFDEPKGFIYTGDAGGSGVRFHRLSQAATIGVYARSWAEAAVLSLLRQTLVDESMVALNVAVSLYMCSLGYRSTGRDAHRRPAPGSPKPTIAGLVQHRLGDVRENMTVVRVSVPTDKFTIVNYNDVTITRRVSAVDWWDLQKVCRVTGLGEWKRNGLTPVQRRPEWDT